MKIVGSWDTPQPYILLIFPFLGILKDFLRELPQPLFPPELLEAVTTAMEKNPGTKNKRHANTKQLSLAHCKACWRVVSYWLEFTPHAAVDITLSSHSYGIP